MRNLLFAGAAAALTLMACKKENNRPQTETLSTTEGKAYGLTIKHNMLHFESAELYDKLVSMEESEVLKVLGSYEQLEQFTSLSESKVPVRLPNEAGYMPRVMLSLLNTDQLITIESKVFRINNVTGKVYAIPAETVNTELLRDLAKENTTNKLIEVRSVDEDLSELLDTPSEKAGPIVGGCPNWNDILDHQKDGDDYFLTGTYLSGRACNGDVTPQGHRLTTFFRYYRGGILFELIMEGWETTLATGANSCSSLTLEVPAYRFQRNKSTHNTYFSATTRTGSGSIYWKPYSGANRLCYFYLSGNLKRSGAPLQSTGLRTIYFNFTP